MSDEPKYELRFHNNTGDVTMHGPFNTWDEAAQAAIKFGWGYWETPAEFKLQDGVTIKAVYAPKCRDCVDSDGWCCNDKVGANCGFSIGHPLYRVEPFRPQK